MASLRSVIRVPSSSTMTPWAMEVSHLFSGTLPSKTCGEWQEKEKKDG